MVRVDIRELREPIGPNDPWIFPQVESVNICWYDGPMVDAAILDVGGERALPHRRYLLELRFDERAFYQKEGDPGAVFARIGLDELEALLELYRRHVPRGGREISP